MTDDPREHIATMEFLVFAGGKAVAESRAVAREQSYLLMLNDMPLVDIQCMPYELDIMAVGFLVSEGLLREYHEFKTVAIDKEARTANVQAVVPEERINDVGNKMKVTSGCGRGVTIDNIDEVMNCNRPSNLTLTMNAREIMQIGHEFNRLPGLYRETKCVHSAALFKDGKIVHFSEDIGRHNAVDKVIGKAFLNRDTISDHILLCTGRFSFDMAAKAARVRIPMIITPAAATMEAILLARKFHITLCGRVQKNSMVVYSTNWRVIH